MTENRTTTETTKTTESPRRGRRGLVIGAGALAAVALAGGIAYGVTEITDDEGAGDVRTVTATGGPDSSAAPDGAGTVGGTDPASFRDAAEQAVAEAGGRGASAIDIHGTGHEVEVELDDGASAEVHVSADSAMRIETEGAERFDGGDPVLDMASLEDALDTALAAAGDAGVPDGTVDSVSASDDRGVSYEVSVRGADGRKVDVDLADDLAVVNVDVDD